MRGLREVARDQGSSHLLELVGQSLVEAVVPHVEPAQRPALVHRRGQLLDGAVVEAGLLQVELGQRGVRAHCLREALTPAALSGWPPATMLVSVGVRHTSAPSASPRRSAEHLLRVEALSQHAKQVDARQLSRRAGRVARERRGEPLEARAGEVTALEHERVQPRCDGARRAASEQPDKLGLLVGERGVRQLEQLILLERLRGDRGRSQVEQRRAREVGRRAGRARARARACARRAGRRARRLGPAS